MNRPFAPAALLALAVLALSLAPPAAAQKAGGQKPKEPPPDYFPLRVNDWWKYRSTTQTGATSEFTMRVAAAEKSPEGTVYEVVIESAWPIKEWYSKPVGSVMWHREAYPKTGNAVTAFAPARQLLMNPPAAGATWTWKGHGTMNVAIDEASTVSGPESVTVPAGTFKAIKVVTKLTQGGTPVTKTMWYANWVGMVRSTTDTGSVQSTAELLDWSFKKP
jgi:hypothetical protein